MQKTFRIDSFLSVNAKTGYGTEELRLKLRRALREMPVVGMRMPAAWMRVKNELAKRRDKHQILTLNQYRACCETEELSEGSQRSLLRYLHHTGFLFRHPEHLQDQIILDQKWALEAIYRLLDRNGWYPVLKGKGIHDLKALRKIWGGDYSEEQVRIFIDLMQSCEQCVEIKEDKNNPEYLIPEFLPDRYPPTVRDVWKTKPPGTYWLKFEHPFFHVALMQRLIVRSAKLAERYDLMWRNGILIHIEDTHLLIEASPEEGKIIAGLHGRNPGEALHRLIGEIKNIQNVEEKDSFFASPDGVDWVEWSTLQAQASAGEKMAPTTDGRVIEIRTLAPLLRPTWPERDGEAQTAGLRELSEQRSGRHLVEAPEPSSPIPAGEDLPAFKRRVKSLLFKDLKAAIDELQDRLSPDSAAFDALLPLSLRYKNLKRSELNRSMDQQEVNAGLEAVQEALLKLINGVRRKELKQDGKLRS